MADQRLDYVNYDFDDLVQQLINRVADKAAWTDTYRSSTGQTLIELYAYVANLVLYYIERRAEESYLETARNRSSVINLVRLLNYIPKLRTSAAGILTFTIPTIHSSNIYIPKYTECQTQGRVKYIVSEDVVLLAGSLSVNANAKQGELVVLESVSNGGVSQEYPIEDSNIEEGSIEVIINGVTWEQVSTFLITQPETLAYRLRYELDDSITIIFGDGQKGKIPPTGYTITRRYVRSNGVDGNVYASDSINVINSTIYDDVGESVEVEVTNTDVFLGGDEREDTEEIRYEAPRVFATGDRAVTKADYIAIIENYAGVANANIWGEAEENPPNYTMFNRVNITLLLQDWSYPSTTFKDTLTDFLYTKSQVTVKYEYVDAVILQVIPVINIKVRPGYVLSTIQDEVEQVFEEQFTLGITTKLGVAKRISDLVAQVDAVTGVSYHHLILDIRQTLTAAYDSFYAYGEVLDALPILPETVRVYVGETQVGIDDGAEAIGATASGYTVSGVVNYATGLVGVDISPTPTEEVYIRYRQDAAGDVEVNNMQICKLHSVNVVGISYSSQ